MPGGRASSSARGAESGLHPCIRARGSPREGSGRAPGSRQALQCLQVRECRCGDAWFQPSPPSPCSLCHTPLPTSSCVPPNTGVASWDWPESAPPLDSELLGGGAVCHPPLSPWGLAHCRHFNKVCETSDHLGESDGRSSSALMCLLPPRGPRLSEGGLQGGPREKVPPRRTLRQGANVIAVTADGCHHHGPIL